MRRGAGAIVRFACSFEAVLIIAIVALELLFCLVATVLIGVGNLSDSAIVPLQIWFVCAVLQLSIAWVPESRHVVWLVSLVMIIPFLRLLFEKQKYLLIAPPLKFSVSSIIDYFNYSLRCHVIVAPYDQNQVLQHFRLNCAICELVF